jgi:hypothetical protein
MDVPQLTDWFGLQEPLRACAMGVPRPAVSDPLIEPAERQVL